MWGTWILSCGKTRRCGRAVEFLIRAKRDEDRCASGKWWPVLTKIFYCKDIENELKSYHNKIEWVKFVLMQDSWPQLKLKNSHICTESVVCREYTLPREKLSEPKGWIRGNTKIGPVLEVTTCCLQCKYGVKIRIDSLNKDHSHSWVRISHGLNKLVTDLTTEQETSEVQFEDFVEIECTCFCEPIKDILKKELGPILNHHNFCSLWLSSVEEIDPSSSSWKSTSRRWWSDWILENKRLSQGSCCVLSSLVWRKLEEKHCKRRRTKEKIPELFWLLRNNSDLWALQGHSGSNFVDPSSQDNVVIPSNFFQYIYHVGCTINLHSIIYSGLIPGGQNLSIKQTIFSLLVDPMDKNHMDPDTIDLNAPRHAQSMHKAWKKLKNTVYWVDINLALRKGLKFYQARSNAIILHEPLPACCIPKVVRMETWELKNEKVSASPRPLPKISLKHDWMKELGSEVARQPEEVARQAKFSQSSQQNPIPCHDRTGNLFCALKEERTILRKLKHVLFVKKLWNPIERGNPLFAFKKGSAPNTFSRDSTNFNVEDETTHDRTEKPVVCRDANHERSMLNEVDIDFRIPGLPHSVVKQADNYRVRELVKKMARRMVSPRQAFNRRRRTREGPEPACVQTPFTSGWHTQEGKDELTSCRGTV